jgi:hypothetical protein
VLAEGVLGEASEIDLLARDSQGRVAVVLVGSSGADLELLARGLAQAEWARRRIRDWLQFAPELNVDPEKDVRVLLLCPAFQPETLLAAASLDRDRIELVRVHWGAGGSRLSLERVAIPHGRDCRGQGEVVPAPFRSDLRDEDLLLTPEERRSLLR